MKAAILSRTPDVVGVVIVLVVCVVIMGRFSIVRVSGASMTPALAVGDLALVRRHALARTGDIALFRLDGDARPTLHRVVSAGGGGLVTRGDANPVSDRRCVPRCDVQGTVAAVVPSGRVIDALRRLVRRR